MILQNFFRLYSNYLLLPFVVANKGYSSPSLKMLCPMKLIIQIPCFNEEASLPVTLSQLPRALPGIDVVEWLVIDDGSTDRTVEVARAMGVDHIVSLTKNFGLAKAFMVGVRACLKNGADIIVNTDADNQYQADDIPNLIAPILEGRAQIVIGARSIDSINHFSRTKKLLQKLGSWVVRLASGTNIPDAPSGFRAISANAARSLNIFSSYTYTLEMIIQAGQKNMTIVSVPVRVNDDLRPSRLVNSLPSYVKRSIVTIVRIFVIYRPFRFFGTLGLILFTPGFLLGLRFLWFYLAGEGGGHIQSVILSGILMMMGFVTFLIAFVADLLAANRKLLEDLHFYSCSENSIPPNNIKRIKF